ncbi:hypothetical protein LINPERPRIM_LOCUS11818 [Linum perenne]
MPRSSRHKSSKHKDAKERDYSDSEKETSLKERKSKEESSSRVLKESASGEKRKLDSKESKDAVVGGGSGNGEHLEGYSSSSKRRKERTEDGGANDRWNGGEDGKGEVSRKSKEKLSESKSKRRDESSKREENAGNVGESEEVGRRSSGKSEGKHKDSNSRKDGTDRDRDRDRKGKETRSEKLVDGEEHRSGKQVSEKTVLKLHCLLHDAESESIQEKRIRRKRDGSGDGDKYLDDVRDNRDRDVIKDGRPKDERYREKYRDEKHRDRAARDRISSRSDDKQARDEPDSTGTRNKKSKPRDNEGDRDRDSDFDRDFEHDLGRDRDHERGRDSDRYREDHDRERDSNRDNDRDHDWDWERNRDRDKDHERDRDRDRDYDSIYADDRRDRNKDSRSRKRSPDDLDDDIKSRTVKGSYTDVEKKPSSISRVEADTDRGRSQSRQPHPDSNFAGSRRRDSPITSPQRAADEYRHGKGEDTRYRDAGSEQRLKTNSSRGGSVFAGGSDRPSRLRSTEKSIKTDDGQIMDLSLERSSSSKVSPMGLVERSPSSSIDRRYMSRNNVRRSLEIEDSGRRNSGSIAARDLPSAEERSTREMAMEKDDSSLNDSSFYNRSNQTNSVLNHPPPSMRGGVGSPSFMGSFDDDGRVNSASRYKRSGDHNMGRGQVNAWRGAPNWSSPLPNGFLPFPHGPPHGGFQAMMPQFPSPPIFGVRPSMEMNHPYHLTDTDRFSGHLRPPLGWPNMMDGSGSSHMHGWDGSNGIFRDESHMFGGPEWNQNRHLMNGHGWDSSSDTWKGQNGDIATDLTSKSLKEDKNQAPADDSLTPQAGQKQNETLDDDCKTKLVESKPVIVSTAKGSSISHPNSVHDRTLDPPKASKEARFADFCNAYLSKVDISSELASSDLYSRCVGLLKVEVNTSVNVAADVLINLKDGARAVPKNSSVFFSNALFPAPSDSIFKKAMDIYKKQRASGSPCLNGGKIDIMQPTSDVEEQADRKDEEETEKPVSEHDTEMPDAPVTNADTEMPDAPVTNVEPIIADNVSSVDKLENEIVETLTEEEVPVHAPTSPVNLELVEEAPNINKEENPCACIGSGIEVDKESSLEDAVIEDAVHEQSGSIPEHPPHQSSPLPNDGQEVDAMVNSTAASPTAAAAEIVDEEEEAVSRSVIVVEDDDGKANEVLMPEPNESESVILSRIHDSPESTH